MHPTVARGEQAVADSQVRRRWAGVLVGLSILLSGCGAAPGTSLPSQHPSVTATSPQALPSSQQSSDIPDAPTPRGYHVLVNAAEHGIVLIGGFDLHDITADEHGYPVPGQPHPGRTADALWIFDESAGWTYLAPSPDIFATDQVSDASYVPEADRVVMHLTDQRSPTTRLLDPASGAVTVSQAKGPIGLVGPMLAYDTESQRVILTGGLGGASQDSWAYDAGTDTWTRMRPQVAPGPRNYAAMAYNPSADRVIVFSGGEPPMADTWAYDFNTNTWTELKPASAPAARYYSQMVYDPTGDRMILFGGILETGSSQPDGAGWTYDAVLDEWQRAAGDTWAYDFDTNAWTEIVTDVAPSPRGWHAMALDERTGHIVLFGGGPSRSTFTGETWIFDPVAETWAEWTG